jgi:indole-3-glycerol phosphate synthase
MSRLNEIFATKRAEVAGARATLPLAELAARARAAAAPRDFVAALRSAVRPGLIAEVKHASPSRGVLVQDFDPLRLARIYAQGGAAAISVLTDERYFRGSLDHLRAIRTAVDLPLLRKDFVYDPYQVYEARAAGADAILLIVAALAAEQLGELHALAAELGMAALVEVHTAAELDTALALRAGLVGINARNLHDFNVSLETTRDLARRAPQQVCLVAESGIHTANDVAWLGGATRVGGGQGIDAILVGEALVTAPDVAAKVRELSSASVYPVRTDGAPSSVASPHNVDGAQP